MGGGLLQLIAVGQMDEYMSINPEFSFYKYAYRRHTNFAMESRQLTFQRNPTLNVQSVASTYDCVISRYGDLLGELYFCFTLPDIYSSDRHRFRWVDNVGSVFVRRASVYIDGTLIDQTTSDWMNVWNELTLTESEGQKYNDMVGNVPEMKDPQLSNRRITIRNNRFIYFYYPEATKESATPSIRSRKIVLPLKFWFTKNPSLALPLLRLQFNIVSVKLELESSERLYQVYAPELDTYVSPTYYNELYNEHIDINTFSKTTGIEPFIEANYVFLSEDERNTIFVKPKLTYMVEQLTINTTQNISSVSASSHNISLVVNNPTKEIIWTLRRDDYLKYNNFNNFSPTIPETNDGIMERAIIRFNSNSRIEEKSAEYFNMIQPYQHHSKIPRRGIYCYSFAIHPEKIFISGYYNAALVKTNILLYLKDVHDNTAMNSKLTAMNRSPYDYDYNVDAYCLSYNVFEIVGSQSGMKFTLSS